MLLHLTQKKFWNVPVALLSFMTISAGISPRNSRSACGVVFEFEVSNP